MKYIVIDEDGQLRQLSAPRYDVAVRDLGPEGWDQVRLGRPDLRGFINDSGMVLPEKYSRNVVGSVLLASLGANIYPYCGPVIITGWDDTSGDDVEIVGLDERQLMQLRTVHGDIQTVLSGEELAHVRAPATWQAAVREIAEAVQTEPLPTPTVLTGDEALAYLRRGRR